MGKHEEWLVQVQKRFSGDKWWNAKSWYPGTKLGDRYCATEAEAKMVLNHALRVWNGKKQYGADGKRYERQDEFVTVACDRRTDRDQEIVKWRIRKRIVTDWEMVDNGEA